MRCWCIEIQVIFVCWYCNLANLLNLFISSKLFFWCVWIPKESLYTRSCYLWIDMVLFLFQSGCLLFIFLAKTSSTMLNRNGESGNPCLVPNLRRKAFRFSIKYILSCGRALYQVEEVPLLFLVSWMFFIVWQTRNFFKCFGVEFCQMFFLHLLRWFCGFC